MQITWHGASCFSIAAKTATIVTDPIAPELRAQLVTLSDASTHDVVEHMQGVTQVVDWPGEVERLGVFIIGQVAQPPSAEVPVPRVLFSIEADGVTVAHVSGISAKLSTEQVDHLGDVDVLLLHVAGGLTPELAKDIVDQVEPRLLLPASDDAEALQKTLTLLGQEPERLEELKLERRDLPEDAMRLVVLAARA